MIKNAAGDKKLKSVVIGGHCGGANRGKVPGILLVKDDKKVRIDSRLKPEDVKKLKETIDKYLEKDATIIICSCGYMPKDEDPAGQKEWKDSLKRLATNLGRRVAAPPGSVGLGGARGCICSGYKLIGQDP